MPATRHLYSQPRRPYYIDAPAYRRTSAGIRVLHLLCHALNSIGEEAYIYNTTANPELDTPILTAEIAERHKKADREPIIVYPEVVAGNPRRAGSVVRYVLNKAGLLGGDKAYAETELIFGYGRNVLPDDADQDNILFLPPIDTQVFNNLDNPLDKQRSGILLYPGRHQSGLARYPELAAEATLITADWPESHQDMADLFRRSEAVYCFESTAIALEAILCGCPAIILPSPFFNGTLLSEEEMGREGIAINDSPEEIAFAKRTVGQMTETYRAAEDRFWGQLDHFVSVTQVMPVHEVPKLPGDDPVQAEAIQRYATWRRRKTLQEIDAQLLAERMVLQWKNRPGIHLLLSLYPGEETLLADTLDSLAAQLYPEWLLTIVTALPPPEGLGETPNIQWLALRDEAHINYVIDEMAAASPGTWLTRIDPGLTLEPQALQVVADYINEKPDWRLIYCDEDTLEADGSFTQPLFKPDFNLDLLRAQAYFGCFIVVAKQAFLAAGRYGDKTGAENYDLSLRILDQNGESSIGHIDQMLAHLPRNSQRAMQPEAEKLAVTDHLARCGLDTAVLDGALFGTRRIQYKWATTPKVSIIIPTRDREEYLRPLLESLFERTRYPNYEVIILDNDSRDPDTVRYLAGLVATEQKQRTRVIAFPGEFSWSGCANAGAEAAEGDYLLFLDNDIHIVQDDWLARLMSIAQRPEVAIVAPRLTYPETGRVQQGGSILGLYGTVGSPWDNQLELSDPGYMGRALCDQNVSAACGSALLVRRSAYVQLGGFDTTHFGLVHGALDLCLRAGDVGHKIVFTPHSALVHYGSISITARQRKLEGRLADLLAAQSANETLIHRWMPRLVHDPAYNRNLSLLEPYKPEHVAPTDWDLHFHDRPRILAIPVPGGAGEYRLRAPLRIVGQAGLAQTMICESPKAFAMRILSPVEIARAAPDALVLHQPLDDSQSDAIENYARYLPKVRRILTIDDLVTDLPKKHPLYKSGYKDGRQRLRRNLALMDRLVVSTRPLADLCVDMIKDIRVMPNCLEWAVWGDAVPPRLPRKKPRVGWAGAQQHQGDLELIYPVVEALADEVDWIFMGMCPPALKPFVHESHGFEIDFSAYPKALARLDLDLAIAPLDIHPFNEAKSNLRLLEYGAMGWPVICTDIYPYQNAPVTRLPNEPETWIKTIREQLAEPEALREAGLTLQAWVHDSFILENHAASWFAAYGP
ncbi:MAG: glycosyltransferase [Zoogloea oleivorans]|jgi:GT2 family glycosyltransferase|uniref:glycosyltransferase n=1 Tax=Zoogloea oleivorans TaxID=1552750 RepID=UPI002A36180F|nr:glycosyltransferase [Zoogloea oleivorans]MDY0035323.1 glycosyltransferase [Zoogloea oleivorans]